MKYIVFVTENVKCKLKGNDRILFGVHATENPEIFDGYLGDSVWINQSNSFMYPKTPFLSAVKKYGVEFFRRITLAIFDNIEEAYKLLYLLITDSPHIYNTVMHSIDFCVNPLYQFDTLGKLVKKWDYPEQAMNLYGYPITRFYNACITKKSLVNSFWSTKDKINVKEYKEVKTHNFITYLYSKEGRLIDEFWDFKDIALILKCEQSEIPEFIKNQVLVNDYYVLNYNTDLFIPRPRVQYVRQTFHVYDNITGEYIGAYKGKSVMKVINQHSWAKISRIFSDNRGYYKDWWLSLEKVDEVPTRKYIPSKIEVYTKWGEYVETLNSVKEMKDKYNVPNAKIKRILQGNKYFGDYIFKYSK